MSQFHTLIYVTSVFILITCLCHISDAAPAVKRDAEVCKEWITPFWQSMVLNEDRDALFADLQRYFIFIDMNGNGKVDFDEFLQAWHESTLMGENDADTIFNEWSVLEDPTDPDFIVDPNVEGLWRDMDRNRNSYVTEEEFTAWWDQELMKLPKHGCPET